jgi:hypothetical protein
MTFLAFAKCERSAIRKSSVLIYNKLNSRLVNKFVDLRFDIKFILKTTSLLSRDAIYYSNSIALAKVKSYPLDRLHHEWLIEC